MGIGRWVGPGRAESRRAAARLRWPARMAQASRRSQINLRDVISEVGQMSAQRPDIELSHQKFTVGHLTVSPPAGTAPPAASPEAAPATPVRHGRVGSAAAGGQSEAAPRQGDWQRGGGPRRWLSFWCISGAGWTRVRSGKTIAVFLKLTFRLVSLCKQIKPWISSQLPLFFKRA